MQSNSITLFCLGILMTIAGCRPEKPIEVSDFPKPKELMLVGITLRGDTIWSIKAVNDRASILAAESGIYEFAKTIDFNSNPTEPGWQVPENWKKLDLNLPFRKATFEIQDSDLESKRTQVIVSEIRMGQQQGAADDSIVANINRWRREMGLEEIINYTINEKGTPVERSASSLVLPFMKKIDVNGQPMYFDKLEGVYQKKRGPAPFANGAMGPMANPLGGSADDKLTKKTTPDDEKVAAESPLEFVKPEQWKQAPGSSMSIARFVVGEGKEEAQVSVSWFPQSTESVNWTSTVTMWQNQLKVDPTEGDELQKITRNLPVDSLSAQYVFVTGQKEKSGTALLGAMIEENVSANPGKWFVKMQGSEATVKSQQANFESFVKSIRFKPVNAEKE